jgi:photosystem II stability/assembly factor-like uncharacterized protein
MVNDEFSPFKRHSGWFSQCACYPLHDAHPGQLEAYWGANKDQAWTDASMKWECVGPVNIAGRVTTLIAHPADPLRLWAGAAAGGVWCSVDGGKNWQTTWPKWASPNIGALAFDAFDPKVIYCASGEANISPDCYPGSGVYVSRDEGATWEVLATADDNVLPRRIGALVSSPHTPGLLYLGGVNLDETQAGGLYHSNDGGKLWLRENSISVHNYWCHSIALHPDGAVFAALEMNGRQTGIYRRDGGDDTLWTQLHGGLPPGDKSGRIGLAIAPSEPDTIYALVSDPVGKEIVGVYRSRNRGDRWTEIGGTEFAAEEQGCYNNAIAVHPKEADTVVCGLNDIHLTRDSGATWARASHWDADEGTPKYVHSDQHAILLPGDKLIYAANDGGVAASEDLGLSWSNRGYGMVTTMFYDIDVAPSNGKIFGGGTQDNGSMVAGVTAKPGEFLHVLDGDGAWMVFDPEDETHVFGSKSDIHIFRHTAEKHWESDFWEEVSPKGLKQDEHHQVPIAVLAIDPGNGHKLWAGSKRLWCTTDDGREWETRSPVLDNTAVTAIEIPQASPGTVLVGTKRGGIFRSTDDGATWSGDLSGPEIPMRVITRIETHPRKPSRIVVTVAGTGMVQRFLPRGRSNEYGGAPITSGTENISHVFLSEDGGSTWKAIDTPEMPQVSYHAAAFETHEPYRLFVANDCGVWMTEDFEKWKDISSALPNVMVTDLVYHHRDRTLTAATYGRGIWRAPVASPVVPSGDATNAGVKR